MKEQEYELKTVNKALDIIEYMSTKTDINLDNLCKAVEMPKTTVFRMVRTLEKRGYIIKDPSGSLCLGPRILQWVSSPIKSEWIIRLQKAARPYMIDLRDLFEDTVNLGIRTGNNIIYIDVVEGTYPVRFIELPGALGPLHATALGKVMLAYLDTAELKNILKSVSFEKLTPNTIDNLDDFLYELQLIKNKGYAIDNEEAVIGSRCVAASILSDEKKPIAAISISAASSRIMDARLESIKIALMDACANIAGVLYS